jgi:hypothetical protein
MFRRIALGAGIALLAALMLGSAAVAKTALTSSSIPADPVAGEPFQVGFTLENHDGIAIDDQVFKVTATSLGTGETLAFEALPRDGSWTATVTLPESGTWFLKVVNENLGFQQELAATFAAPAPAAPVTTEQLSTALEGARAEIARDFSVQYAGRLTALETDVTTLQKSVAEVAGQRDALQAQNDSLRASIDARSDFSPWLAALIGAAAALATLAAGLLLAVRRGLVRRERQTVAVRA